MKLLVAAVFAIVVMLSAPSAFANTPESLDAQAIRTQQAKIRSDAEAGTGRYASLDKRKRAELFSRQDRVLLLIGGIEVTTELDETRRIALFNELEAIGAIVNFDDDDRLICERIRPVGSNRPTTLCKSVAQRRLERERAQTDIVRRDNP